MPHANDPAYPHLLPGPARDGRPWNVHTCTTADSRVHLPNHEMHVPTIALATDMLVHLHEYRHVVRGDALSPRFVTGNRFRDGIRKMLTEVAVEVDQRRSVDVRQARDDLDWTVAMLPGSEPDAVLWYFQLAYSVPATTNADLRRFFAGVCARVQPTTRDLLDRAIREVEAHSDVTSLDELADWLAAALGMADEVPETPTTAEPGDEPSNGGEQSDEPTGGTPSPSDEDGEDAAGGGDADEDGEPSSGKPFRQSDRVPPELTRDVWVHEPQLPGDSPEAKEAREDAKAEAAASEKATEQARRALGALSGEAELTYATDYGKVDVHRHTLDREATTQVAVTWRAADGGSTIRYPANLYRANGRVFGVKAQGGSILVDASGSMNWAREQLAAAMEKLPRLWAGFYTMHAEHLEVQMKAGRYRQPAVPTTGHVARVCVVASDGKLGEMPDHFLGARHPLTPNAEPHTGENGEADKATLAWLVAHAPKPWVWVSDGKVEAATTGNYPAVDALLRKHHIPRVETVEAAIDYLTGKAVRGYTECSDHNPQTLRIGGAFMQDSKPPRSPFG